MLQIAKARGMQTTEQHARERELLAEHAGRWLAPLPIERRGVRFERGFVAACETAGFLDDHPAWSTVRAVNAVPASDRCHTASLRAVTGVAAGGIVRLAELARPLLVEELVWTGPTRWADAHDAWPEIRVLPRLRALVLHGESSWVEDDQRVAPEQLAFVWRSRHLPSLAELTLPIAPGHLAAWVAALDASPLRRVELRSESEDWRPRAWRLILERDTAGALSRLTVLAPAAQPSNLRASEAADQVCAGIRALPPTLTYAHVSVPGATWQAYATARAMLEAALVLHPRAQLVIDSER